MIAHKQWAIGFVVAKQSHSKPMRAAVSGGGAAGAIPRAWSAEKSGAG